MVRPGGIAQPDRPRRTRLQQEISRHPEGAGSAWGLSRDRSGGLYDFVIDPEDEVAHRRLEAGPAVYREVALGARRLEQTPLGLDDGRDDRRDAGLIDVNADREVDLARPGVGLEGFGQTQDWIGRSGRQGA